jgi:hypothetical protein
MRVIEVTISPTGETTVQTKGYVGGSCLQASKFLEEALGTVTGERKTNEFFEQIAVEQQQHNQA